MVSSCGQQRFCLDWVDAQADLSLYAPNFEGVAGAYYFWVVRPSVCASVRSSKTVHARILKFHIWIPHGKNR